MATPHHEIRTSSMGLSTLDLKEGLGEFVVTNDRSRVTYFILPCLAGTAICNYKTSSTAPSIRIHINRRISVLEKSSLKNPLKWALAGRRTEGYAIFLAATTLGPFWLQGGSSSKQIVPTMKKKKRKEGKGLWFFRRQTQPFFCIVPAFF